MRVVVFGATGNVGTSVLESIEHESGVQEIVAVARRAPNRQFARTRSSRPTSRAPIWAGCCTGRTRWSIWPG